MSTEPGGSRAGKGELPLDFEAWAELSARLLKLDQEQRLDVLDERGLDVDDWMRCDEHHCLALADDVAPGRMERAESYGRRCAAELDRRRREPAPAPAEAVPAHEEEPAEPEAQPVVPLVAEASFPKEFMLVAPMPASLAETVNAPDFPTFLKQADPLPFAGRSSPEIAASAPRAAPSPGVGETIDIGTDLLGPLRGTLPFVAQSAGPTFPRLPLKSYASLCAELSVFPESAAEILNKYGIRDEQARRALDEDWRARFSNHPETWDEWQQLCTTYKDWLRQHPR